MKRRYVAFLRAVNVGGRVVRMAALKRIFERLGLADVETFIASGNVAFISPAPPARLEATIEEALLAALGYPVSTFIRTPAQIAAIARGDPFGPPMPPGGRTYVAFVRRAPTAAARRKIEELSTATDRFAVRGRELYWRCVVPSTQSIGSGAILEKIGGQAVTLRNLNTVRRLAEKYPVRGPSG